ncbi:aldo/keto reductase [candidate division KSB1 bacterium]|nr:aldo/keto reductase [candidate division KSB1 bacterium]
MIYKEFGNTGVQISSLGFGCMRLPMVKVNGKNTIDQEKVSVMLQRAYELGVNYFDSAYFYNEGLSEAALGKSVKDFRDKIYISTKSPGHLIKKPGDYRRILEEQMQRLDMDYIDFYHFHGIGYDNFLATDKNSGWIKDADQAKSEGLIRHISFSFHDNAANMKKLIDLGLFESVLCQYSVVDRANEHAMAYAKEKGLGVVVMGPLGGGRVTGLPKEVSASLGIQVQSNAELALRFVFANPNVDCALSGMEHISMVEENATISARREPLSPQEVSAISGMMKENEQLAELYCTGCGYCMPCPSDVNIPHIFRMMNYYKIYNIVNYARKGYAEIGTNPWVPGNRADACTECGTCEDKCPQKIQIIDQLKESHRALSAV